MNTKRNNLKKNPKNHDVINFGKTKNLRGLGDQRVRLLARVGYKLELRVLTDE